MTLRILKTEPVWQMDANGHVLRDAMFREMRRSGATSALMSGAQWEGYFNGRAVEDPQIDKIKVLRDDTVADDEVRFFNGHELVGVMRRLWVSPPPED